MYVAAILDLIVPSSQPYWGISLATSKLSLLQFVEPVVKINLHTLGGPISVKVDAKQEAPTIFAAVNAIKMKL